MVASALTFDSPQTPLTPATQSKAYIAVEGDGTVAVVDTDSNKLLTTINLSEGGISYSPHNVEASPDGKFIWVTANAAMADAHGSSHGHEEESSVDQVIAIDPATDQIVVRIPIGSGQHLAHVVADNKGVAFVAAQETSRIYTIDTKTMAVADTIKLPTDSGPHGMRLSADGKTLYVALMSGSALGIVDTTTGKVETRKLAGMPVQVAPAPDGSWVAASLYDTKQVAVYRPETDTLSYIGLPKEAQGPLQLYATSDSQAVYVADQGTLAGRPANNRVYKIDVASGEIIQSIEVGSAPHGVALSRDNTRGYITNLKDASLSVVDLAAGKEVVRIPVGEEPNGIALWSGTVQTAQGKVPNVIAQNGLHWHARVKVIERGIPVSIPANMGLGATHNPIHTHDDEPGLIHMEFGGKVTTSDIELGKFFAVWNRSFGQPTRMVVNGKDNTEYAQYQMKDGDSIELYYN